MCVLILSIAYTHAAYKDRYTSYVIIKNHSIFGASKSPVTWSQVIRQCDPYLWGHPSVT